MGWSTPWRSAKPSNRIVVTARSRVELAARVEDWVKRGYSIKSEGKDRTPWAETMYWTVVIKAE